MDSVTTHDASTIVGSRIITAMPIFIVRGEITESSLEGMWCGVKCHQAKATWVQKISTRGRGCVDYLIAHQNIDLNFL